MASAIKKVATIGALSISAFAVVISATPALANQIDIPPTGVTVNHNSPNYDVTIDCDNLPYGGQELFTGPTQHGTYTLHTEANCQDNANFQMRVDDNGDTDEVGAFTIDGTTYPTRSSWMAMPATMTLAPDTVVTIQRVNDITAFFNVRYNGSDVNQTAPTPEPTVAPVTKTLANTGADLNLYSWFAAGLFVIGLGFTAASKRIKNRK